VCSFKCVCVVVVSFVVVVIGVVVFVLVVSVVVWDGVCNSGEFCYYFNSNEVGLILDFIDFFDDYGVI